MIIGFITTPKFQTVINQSRSFTDVWKDLEKWIEEKRVSKLTEDKDNEDGDSVENDPEHIKSLCFITDG